MKTTAYVYVDAKGYLVYAHDKDSFINHANDSLRRFEMPYSSVGIFIRYYELKIHPNSLKNIVK